MRGPSTDAPVVIVARMVPDLGKLLVGEHALARAVRPAALDVERGVVIAKALASSCCS